MKRKVIEIAGSTFLVSLPRKWAVAQNIHKGDEIDVREDGSKIIVMREEKPEVSRATVDVSNLERALVKQKIFSAYVLGFDEIKVVYQNPQTLYLRTRKEAEMVTTASIIEEVSREMIGFEVIDHRTEYFILKDLGGYSQAEFEEIFMRVFTLIKNLADDTLIAVEKLDLDSLGSIRETRPQNIRKFVYYCLRSLNRVGSPDFRKTNSYYHFILELKTILSVYRFIARENMHIHKKVNPQTMKVFHRVNELFTRCFHVYQKYDEKELVDILKERNSIYQVINSLSTELPRHDILLLSRLAVVLFCIQHLVQVHMVLEF